VSSTLLDIPGLGGVLLDAGEGTLGQIRRRFGTAGMAEQIYPNLKMIFISHMHADHHLGLRLVLEDRLKVCER
jgi:ribonuclease Z